MGNTNYVDGTAYTSITGLEYNRLIIELSFKSVIKSDDGLTIFSLFHIKSDTTISLIKISEYSTDGWKDYTVFDTINNLQKEDTLKIFIHNHFGFTNGTFVSKFDDIQIVSK